MDPGCGGDGLALLAMAGMFAYMRVQAMSELPALEFPASPTRIIETLPAVTPPGSQRFVIQVATFETMSRAERLVERLTSVGYQARAMERYMGEQGRIVEVLIGDFRTADEAKSDLSVIRSVHGFVDARVEPFSSVETR